jgi:nucleotide-binding universal stress UspA family protein
VKVGDRKSERAFRLRDIRPSVADNSIKGESMFKRILVAVDASQTGDLALETAIRLASESRAQLRIVHAVDTSNINMGVEVFDKSSVSERLVSNGQDILKAAQRVADAAGIAAETRLVTIKALNKRIPEAIADEADAWPADLIVVGTHGRRGLSRLFLGSVAEGVMRVATKPVLLIRGK